MTNLGLILKAVTLVEDFFDAESIYDTNEAITNRVLDWYTKTYVTDPETLAAAAITGSYIFGTSLDEMKSWKEFYFPTSPIEETVLSTPARWIDVDDISDYCFENDFHIGEIEAAQRDILWQ